MQPSSVNLLVLSSPGAKHLSVLKQLSSDVRVTISDDPETLKAAAPETDVLLNGTGRGDLVQEIWPHLAKLRWIHSVAAGVEHQLFPEFVESEIPLTNSKGVFRESLGEFVIAAALFFAKDLRRMVRNQEAGRWEQFDVEELHKQTMGVVGYGQIGRTAAAKAKALGMRILALRRRAPQPDGVADEVYEINRIGDMMAASDVVVAAAPLTPDTRGLIGDRELRRMKHSAILVNVGRGPVIDEAALISALGERRIRGAALDVFNEEPLPAGHAFWKLDNVLLSPHCADHTADWLEQAMLYFLEELRRFREGQSLHNIVDKRAGY